MNSTYPEEVTKAVKGVIRKRAKKFQFVDQGVLSALHYTENTGSLPDDRVGAVILDGTGQLTKS